MFISPAYAQAAGGGASGVDALQSFLPLVLIFIVFYFLLIRPQQKKMKQHKEMLAALRRGDRVVTAGGIIGQVVKVSNDGEVQVEIAEGVRVKVVRGTIAEVLAKTEPVGGGKDRDDGDSVEAGEAASGGKASGLGKLLGGKDKA